MKKISELMLEDVATCRATDTLNRVAQLMWERRCGCLPVLDDRDRVVGMITDRDVCMAAYTQGKDLHQIVAATSMSTPALTCPPTASIDEVEELMRAHGVHRVIVADQNGHLAGLVSLDELARTAAAWDGRGEIDLERIALTFGEVARRHGRADVGADEPPDAEMDGLVANSIEALRTLRDEIRVDVKLAGEELRGRWRRLEDRLHAAEQRAKERRRDGARNLAALVESARQFRSRLRQDAERGSRANGC
jgi:CBS domain-containing protein